MRKLRQCEGTQINSGSSMCRIDWGKILGAIMVEPGVKIPEFTAEALKQLCHADRPGRIYPIGDFVEYAKSGGEPQVGATGYGPNQFNGLNAQTDSFTLPKFDEMVNANLLKGASLEWDVYFFDKDRVYGYNDGTEELAGLPMSTVYPTPTPFSTSGSKSQLVVNFCHADIEDAYKNIDFVEIDFNANKVLKGLTEVVLIKDADNKYKLVEKIGGYDVTAKFGEEIAKGAQTVLIGATSAEYKDGKLTIVAEDGATPKLAAPSILLEAGIEYIEGVVA